MSDIGSPEWIARCQRRAAKLEVAPELVVTIEHRLTGDEANNDDATIWHVQINKGQVTYCAGPHPHPTLTLSGSRSTLEAICNGAQSAQRAFLDGTLTVVGDMAKLLENQIALEEVAASLMIVSANS